MPPPLSVRRQLPWQHLAPLPTVARSYEIHLKLYSLFGNGANYFQLYNHY